MKTIFRPILIAQRLPDKEGFYFVGGKDGTTSKWWDGNQWVKEDSFIIDYWLEEVPIAIEDYFLELRDNIAIRFAKYYHYHVLKNKEKRLSVIELYSKFIKEPDAESI